MKIKKSQLKKIIKEVLNEDKSFDLPFGSATISGNKLTVDCNAEGWDGSDRAMHQDMILATKGQNDPLIDSMERELEANGIDPESLRGQKAKMGGGSSPTTLIWTLSK